MLGLWGMGGIVKTTLATALFNDLLPLFENSTCFLANVRERASQPRGLVDMQLQLLKALGAEIAELHDEDAGTSCLRLLVLTKDCMKPGASWPCTQSVRRC